MIRTLQFGLVVLLLAIGAFLGYAAIIVVSDEIVPSVRPGSVDVTTETMILNHVWKGNEIYALVLVYVAGAVGSLTGGWTLIKRWRSGTTLDA